MKLGADGENNAKRLGKVYKLYASKACRKSIMIGQALSYDSMSKIVTNMSQLNQPWVKFVFVICRIVHMEDRL